MFNILDLVITARQVAGVVRRLVPSMGVLAIAGFAALISGPVWAQAGCLAASGGHGWAFQPFVSQTSQFTAEFDAVPSSNHVNSLIGFSDDRKNSPKVFAILIRFNRDGNIDASNGGAFSAANVIPYHARLKYHFKLDVDVVAHTFSVSVQPQGKIPPPFMTVGTNFAFRPAQASVFNLDNIGALVDAAAGTLTVCKLAVTALAPQIPNPNCTLILPSGALTATGLSTPFQLTASNSDDGVCHELNSDQSAFVQAAILDPATGQISIYNPLIIDKGTTPAAPPVVPVLPSNAVVALWFGYNGDVLTLSGPGSALADAHCVNGLPRSPFGQYSYCNAPAFFQAAHLAIASKKLIVPPLGIGKDGRACPTTRDFFVIDQDPSDNLTTTYLATASGQVAQHTQANIAKFTGAKTFGNPSDERLVDALLDPALGCTPWTVPDLADPGQMVPALPLNELQAGAWQLQPIALVPLLDPMALVNGKANLAKLNAYRAGVDQPPASSLADADPTLTCTELRSLAPARLMLDRTLLSARPSPFPNLANTLFTFMAQRYVATYEILSCQDLLNLADPITLTQDSNGVTIDATIH